MSEQQATERAYAVLRATRPVSPSLTTLYFDTVASHGKAAADAAATASIERFNCEALAGADLEQCEAEQAAAFAEALETIEPEAAHV